MKFELQSKFEPAGDQPQAIASLVSNLKKGLKHQTLWGVTGSGKTFTIANVINEIQRPTLVIAHNKTLAAQLADEFRMLFPNNSVQYFVSYYDYYQPEAYIPITDTYIEKDSAINDEIDRLRHAATHALLTRKDVIIVASVSCIYGIGSPKFYQSSNFTLKVGEATPRDLLLKRLTEQQYERNDLEIKRGNYRLRGDSLELFPAYAEGTIKVEFFGDLVEKISEIAWPSGQLIKRHSDFEVFPAKHFITPADVVEQAIDHIRKDLEVRLAELRSEGKLLEAQRLEQRTRYDLEMIEETGTCQGIENYSLYFDGRKRGEPATTLIDYFPASPVIDSDLRFHSDRSEQMSKSEVAQTRGAGGSKDFLLVIDESHMTIPQIGAMYGGDRSRKEKLIEYGFRLPTAFDNRPLKFDEFYAKTDQMIFVSATPGEYELSKSVLRLRSGQACQPASAVIDSEVAQTRGAGGRVSKTAPFAIPASDQSTEPAPAGSEPLSNDFDPGSQATAQEDNKKGAYPLTSLPADQLGAGVVRQFIRPTGLLDPEIEVRKTAGQVNDLLSEIRLRTKKNQRSLVTTLTKRMAEELTEYLKEQSIKVAYIHSDVATLERSKILHQLRLGKYDVLVGINLLREGLDLPEVSLVAILDADKEGFLRSRTSLIQTIGRAARHAEGKVVMYADRITDSMAVATKETTERRQLQLVHNQKFNIKPKTINKTLKPAEKEIEEKLVLVNDSYRKLPRGEKRKVINELSLIMNDAALKLEFEKAAEIRDQINVLEGL